MTDQSIDIVQDRSMTILIPVYNSDGTVADLDGASAKWRLVNRRSAGGTVVIQNDAVPIISTTINGDEVPTLAIELAPDDTDGLSAMQLYQHEAVVIMSDERIFTVVSGIVRVTASVIPAEA